MQIVRLLLIILILVYSEAAFNRALALNNSSLYQDGRSTALGGGRNAIEEWDSGGFIISYLLPYNLKDLSTRSVQLKFKTHHTKVESSWAQIGDLTMQENYISLGASRSLSKSISFGVKGGYYFFTTINQEKGSTLMSELNFIYSMSEELLASIYLFNPTGAKIKLSGGRYAMFQSFHFGLQYNPTKKATLLTEIEKQQNSELKGHFGIETAIIESLKLRVGFSVKPLMPSWGIGGTLKHFSYSLGGNSHPILGLSSCFTLKYNWR